MTSSNLKGEKHENQHIRTFGATKYPLGGCVYTYTQTGPKGQLLKPAIFRTDLRSNRFWTFETEKIRKKTQKTAIRPHISA